MTAVALRLDEETRRRLTRAAQRRGTSRSALIREALEDLLERDCADEATRPYERARKLIASVDGGDPLRSEGGGSRVAEILRETRSG